MTTDDTKDLLQELYVCTVHILFLSWGIARHMYTVQCAVPNTCTVLYTVPNTSTVQVTVFVVTTEFGEAALDTKQSRMRNSLVCKNSLLSEKKLSLGKPCMRNSLEAKQPCMRNSLVCETDSAAKQIRVRNIQ